MSDCVTARQKHNSSQKQKDLFLTEISRLQQTVKLEERNSPQSDSMPEVSLNILFLFGGQHFPTTMGGGVFTFPLNVGLVSTEKLQQIRRRTNRREVEFRR